MMYVKNITRHTDIRVWPGPTINSVFYRLSVKPMLSTGRNDLWVLKTTTRGLHLLVSSQLR